MANGDELGPGGQGHEFSGRLRAAKAGHVLSLRVAGVGAHAWLGFFGEEAVPVDLREFGGDGPGLLVKAGRKGSRLVLAPAFQPARGQFARRGDGACLPPDLAVRQEPAESVPFGRVSVFCHRIYASCDLRAC